MPATKPPHRPRKRHKRTLFATWLDRAMAASAEITVETVAETLGVSTQSVYNYRNGHARPSRRVANEIAELSAGEVPASAWDQPKSKPRAKSATK